MYPRISGLDKRFSGSQRKQKHSRRAFCLVVHQLKTIHSRSGVTFRTPGFHFGVASCLGLASPVWGAPWPLDPKDRRKPKSDLAAPADSTGASSPDESKKRRKKKKHRRPRRSELKVTTQGLGTDNPVWTNTGSAGSSSSTASSHSEGDSGLGSNLRVTDTEAQTRAPLRPSPDARGDPSQVMEDAPLSDRDGANEDLEMVDAEVIEAEQPGGDGGSAPRCSPDPEEVPERIPDQPEDNPDKVAGKGDPQVPQDPQDDSPEPHQQVLQGFRTVAQTFSAAYGNASFDIQRVIRRSLRESTNDDRTFIYGASNVIRRWVESVCPAMGGNQMARK